MRDWEQYTKEYTKRGQCPACGSTDLEVNDLR